MDRDRDLRSSWRLFDGWPHVIAPPLNGQGALTTPGLTEEELARLREGALSAMRGPEPDPLLPVELAALIHQSRLGGRAG